MSDATPGGHQEFGQSPQMGAPHPGGWGYAHNGEPVIPVPYAQAPPPLQSPPHYGATYPGWGPVHVAPKSPGVALLCSFLLPGLGSMMNGETGKGIGILVGWIFSLLLTVLFIGFFGMLGFWIWGMVDAHQGAVRWNAARGIVS